MCEGANSGLNNQYMIFLSDFINDIITINVILFISINTVIIFLAVGFKNTVFQLTGKISTMLSQFNRFALSIA